MGLKELLGSMESEAVGLKMKKKKQLEVISKMVESISAGCQFKPGDVVTQIDAFRKYRFPEPGDPAVVVDVFDAKPQEGDTGSSVEYIDMYIGVLVSGEREEPRVYKVESFRFEKY
jgi:C-terminal processing protease CtpA/Prc